MLKSGKYVYTSGYQESNTLTVGGTTLTNELFGSFTWPFLAQLDAKTGTVVAASNQIVPAVPFMSDARSKILLDGKVRRKKGSPLVGEIVLVVAQFYFNQPTNRLTDQSPKQNTGSPSHHRSPGVR